MTQTTDKNSSLLGWVEYMIDAGVYDLHISVDPKADLDDRFKALGERVEEQTLTITVHLS
tara:strand:- start:96 stop:275 length:180 start_codon:yes stop_codon:yes gene_type:complete